ncbi:tuftelin [Arapaima gigas]
MDLRMVPDCITNNKKKDQVTMFSDEVSHVQEVRYCLRSLRQQMAARGNKSEHKGTKDQQNQGQKLLGGPEHKSVTVQDKIKNDEEKSRMRTEMQDRSQRVEQLEKNQVILKERIHHLEDMLKSQQRKIRNMIEQLQNSRNMIQERDKMIQDLEEKVAFLEAENREMHDQMECFLAGTKPISESKPEVVYSKPLKTSSDARKPLPFIKVIEIKS